MTGLSCGYTCEVHPVSGVWIDPDGVEHRFDAMQVAISGNHVAICDNPRAGPTARIRTDEGPAMADDPTKKKKKEEEHDGEDKLKAEDNANSQSMDDDDADQKEDEEEEKKKKKEDSLSVRLDRLEAENAVLKDQLKKVSRGQNRGDALRAELKEVAACHAVLEGSKSMDEILSMPRHDRMRLAIGETNPGIDTKNRSNEAVEAMFEVAVSGRFDSAASIRALITPTPSAQDRSDSPDPAADARAKMIERQQNAWQTRKEN